MATVLPVETGETPESIPCSTASGSGIAKNRAPQGERSRLQSLMVPLATHVVGKPETQGIRRELFPDGGFPDVLTRF